MIAYNCCDNNHSAISNSWMIFRCIELLEVKVDITEVVSGAACGILVLLFHK